MENNPKKSKAFIIAFILILLLLLIGYYLFTNRTKIFDTKGATTFGKVFAPLLGTSKDKGVNVINTTGTDVTSGPITGIVITDQSGNKIVRAEAGEPLKKGDVLYISGFNKNKDPIVMKAISNDKKKSLVFGVAGEDMLKGAMGNVIIEGILSGVPTNKTEITLWAPTNPLYLSDKTYGGMTKNPPFAPSFVVQVGSVISIDPINGSIRIGGIITAVNPEILNTSSRGTRDYLGSIFGNNNGNDNGGGGGDGGGGSSGNNNDNNGFILNSITLPGTLGSYNNFPTVTVVASPSSVKIGETSTISWISTKATVCDAGAGRGTGTTGSFKTSALSRSMSFSVTCTGANGSRSSGNAFVTIIDSETGTGSGNTGSGNTGSGSGTGSGNTGTDFSSNFPLVKVTAKPLSIKSGLTSTISWVASKSISCNAGAGRGTGTTGSFKTSALTKSMSYTITCKNAAGDETSGDAFVNVIDYNGGNNNFPTVQIKATPMSLKTDASSVISWTSKNTTSCDAGVGNGTGVSGSFNTGPMKESKSYTIVCKGENGEASGNTFVNVTDNYKFPIVTLTAVPPSVDKGKKSTISWVSTNTTSCYAGAGHGTKVSGSFETEALSVSKSYSVTCVGPNGSKGSNISVNVNGGDDMSGKPECSDGKDNNGNDLIDINEPNCHVDGDLNKAYLPAYISESTTPTQCSDGVDNDVDNLIDKADPGCHLAGDLNKEYIPLHTSESVPPTQCSDKKDNDGDTFIDKNDPNCHTDGDMTKEYVPTWNSEVTSPKSPYENTCKVMDNYPLEFTDQEQAGLDELLRKFYLIAPTLKTEEDIKIAYSEITQFQNLSEHLTTLVNQCYDQIDGPKVNGIRPGTSTYRTAGGQTTRYGNPWYQYSTNRGSYIDTTTKEGKALCMYTSGWFKGTAPNGKDCSYYNEQLYAQTPPSCTIPLRVFELWGQMRLFSNNAQQKTVVDQAIAANCVWIPGASMSELENIVNVW